MDEDDELVRRLMAAVTARLEDAHAIAVAGQGRGYTPADCYRLACRLARAGREVEAVAVAVQVLLRQGDDEA